MKKNLLILFFGCMVLTACRKPENRVCFKSTGDQKTLQIPLNESFDRLFLNPHVAYVIVQDSLNMLEITGGANLINHIEYELKDNLLVITNKNRCSFLRNYQDVVVTIHLTKLLNIRYEGSVYLKSLGTLQAPYFTLQVRDGAGPVTLDMDSQVIDADISHGWGDYTLTGTTAVARISARSNGYCDTYGLTITDSLYVASETPGTIKVKADGIPMCGYAKGSGDIWYRGTPSYIDVFLAAKGKVLNKN